MLDHPKSVVRSIAKAFQALEGFASAQAQLTIKEATTAAGLDRGTAFRLLHTLLSLGYLASVPDTRRFRLTLKCLELWYAALASGGLKAQQADRPHRQPHRCRYRGPQPVRRNRGGAGWTCAIVDNRTRSARCHDERGGPRRDGDADAA